MLDFNHTSPQPHHHVHSMNAKKQPARKRFHTMALSNDLGEKTI